MPRHRPREGASRPGAPFFSLWLWGLLWLAAFTPAVAGTCSPDRVDAEVAVRFVYDGDTVEIEDPAGRGGRRRLRFIGLNTPEMGRDGAPPEPFALAARDRLRRLLADSGDRLRLRFGRERRDRYGRLLAHPFLVDGSSVTERLLREGLGWALVVPPNEAFAECHFAAEEEARRARRGLWAKEGAILHGGRLPPDLRGFHLVHGRVVRVGHSRKSVWINLEGGVAARVARDDLVYFDGMDLDALEGRSVTVRGWFRRYKGDPVVRLRHPLMLQVEAPADLP